MTEQGAIQNIDLGIIDPKEARFYFTDGGFCGLKLKEADYPHITLKRALPVGNPSGYISVYDSENKEVGIIKDLSDLNGENLDVVAKELDNRYFCPAILEVKSVKDKLGYVYAEFLLTSDKGCAPYAKSCALKDVSKNIRMLDDKRVMIFDVDGNRYLIKDIDKLDKAGRKRLEPFLF